MTFTKFWSGHFSELIEGEVKKFVTNTILQKRYSKNTTIRSWFLRLRLLFLNNHQ